MGHKLPPASERQRSQRPSREVRAAQAEATEAQRLRVVKDEEKQNAMRHRNSEAARLRALEAEVADLRPPTLEGKSSYYGKLKHKSDAFYAHVNFGFDWLKKFDPTDVPLLVVAVLRKLGRETCDKQVDFCWETLMADGIKASRSALLEGHEKKIAKHLTDNVYTADHFSLLRLVGGMSKRLCGLIEQAIKYVHNSDGTKTRQTLLPDSKEPAPSLFGLKAINAAEAKAEKESETELREHPDRMGADICGKANALDHAMLKSIKNTSRSGGMATFGSKTDPHLMCMTGDGHFPGSTNLLNQSSLDVCNWLFYRAAAKAEDYTVLHGRLSAILPDLCRLYNNGEPGELLLDGEPTGVFVKLVLVADKPFIRHVCGMLSHNADAFGAPFCTCADETDRPALYCFSMDKRSHYGKTTVEDLCKRAHVAPWEVLRQPEPEYWFFQCPCCPEKFGTDHGGRRKLDALDEKLAAMDQGNLTKELQKHAKLHHAQQLRRGPLLPFHHVVHDPMHAVHNEMNALLDEAIHKHLVIETTDKEVKAVLATAQAIINALWKAAYLPKYIQFGKDNKGAHSHALNGPCMEAVFGKPQLIIDSIKAMAPVYALLESKKLTPELGPEALAAAQNLSKDSPATTSGAKAGDKRGNAVAKAKPAKKVRRANFGDPLPPPATPKAPAQDPQCSEPCDPQTAPKEGLAEAHELTYSQRVGAAFVAFIQFYMYLKSDHNKLASALNDTMRAARADKAIDLALEMQRAMIALIGTQRRRTYAHDLVYGTYQQYMLFAKPWNCATEGNEHAHQDMKKFFKDMATHNPNARYGDCFQVLRMIVIKDHFLHTKSHLLPATNYAASRANHVLAQHSIRMGDKRRGADSGPKGLKMYGDKATAKLAACSEEVEAKVVQCQPCE